MCQYLFAFQSVCRDYCGLNRSLSSQKSGFLSCIGFKSYIIVRIYYIQAMVRLISYINAEYIIRFHSQLDTTNNTLTDEKV